MARTRMTHDDRRRDILEAAMQIARKSGFSRITRDGVAAAAGVSSGLVSYHFTDANGLRDAVVDEAIIIENVKLLGEALVAGNRRAMKAPPDLKRQALVLIIGGGKKSLPGWANVLDTV